MGEQAALSSAGLRVASALLLAAIVLPTALVGVTCNVPAVGYPTVGSAVRDVACTAIQLAAGTFEENVVVARDVTIAGAGTTATIIAGAVEVTGPATDVALSALAIDGTATGVAGCWQSLLAATGGARLQSNADLRVTNSGLATGACRLFADGFESAGMLAWSNQVP